MPLCQFLSLVFKDNNNYYKTLFLAIWIYTDLLGLFLYLNTQQRRTRGEKPVYVGLWLIYLNSLFGLCVSKLLVISTTHLWTGIKIKYHPMSKQFT